MIQKKSNGTYREYGSVLTALGLQGEEKIRLCVAGAGGKTSLLKRIAMEYKEKGIPAVVTTTTHMYAEDSPCFLLEPSGEKVEEILKKEGVAFLGKRAGNGKMKAPDPSWMNEILSFSCPVLIEADGARRLPMKIPGEGEPVYPAETTHVLYVYGMEALGKPLQEVCFRSELASALLERRQTDPVREEDIAGLAMHSGGARKKLQNIWKCTIVLSQADEGWKREAAERIGQMIRGDVLILGRDKAENRRKKTDENID